MKEKRYFTRDLASRHEQLLAERGGRLAYAFFRLRNGLHLTTSDEQRREELIGFHERRRQDPKGMLWPEDDMTERERESWRIIGPGH